MIAIILSAYTIRCVTLDIYCVAAQNRPTKDTRIHIDFAKRRFQGFGGRYVWRVHFRGVQRKLQLCGKRVRHVCFVTIIFCVLENRDINRVSNFPSVTLRNGRGTPCQKWADPSTIFEKLD